MKSKGGSPVLIALYGMDERAKKMMAIYFQGACHEIAVVADELDAEIDLIDADFVTAKDILEKRRLKTPDRPIILLSFQDMSIEGVICVKKPLQMQVLINAIKSAISMKADCPIKPIDNEALSTIEATKQDQAAKPIIEKETLIEQIVAKKNIDNEEKKKISKHRTATDLTERGFSAYIGYVEGLDYSNAEQMKLASYNPKHFFLGYVQSAFKVAKKKGRILQLNSGWKPLIILPHSHEVWLDADDKQLRAFSGLTIKKSVGKSMSLTAVNQESSSLSNNLEQFYDMDTFIWKLAIWTSKGRYPVALDINKPIFLKQWPNFTRLVVTPHALQIAALLINEPRSILNISTVLKVKPQYVYVFVSAAFTLGLIGQSRRHADTLLIPQKISIYKSKSLLNRILGRLRS